MRWVRRGVVALAAIGLGAMVALFTVALHGYWWGLVLGLATTAATLVALPGGWGRMPFALGWAALVIYASQVRPEGDFVIGQDVAGWTVLVSAVVVLILGMIGARRPLPVVSSDAGAPPAR